MKKFMILVYRIQPDGTVIYGVINNIILYIFQFARLHKCACVCTQKKWELCKAYCMLNIAVF